MYSNITLVIPAKNESESLPKVLDELKMARAEILGAREYNVAKLNIQDFSYNITKNLAEEEIQLPTLINLWFKFFFIKFFQNFF